MWLPVRGIRALHQPFGRDQPVLQAIYCDSWCYLLLSVLTEGIVQMNPGLRLPMHPRQLWLLLSIHYDDLNDLWGYSVTEDSLHRTGLCRMRHHPEEVNRVWLNGLSISWSLQAGVWSPEPEERSKGTGCLRGHEKEGRSSSSQAEGKPARPRWPWELAWGSVQQAPPLLKLQHFLGDRMLLSTSTRPVFPNLLDSSASMVYGEDPGYCYLISPGPLPWGDFNIAFLLTGFIISGQCTTLRGFTFCSLWSFGARGPLCSISFGVCIFQSICLFQAGRDQFFNL